MTMTLTLRNIGRPPEANPLTPAQRSKRYRDKKRAAHRQAVVNILEFLFSEAAKPCDAEAEKLWQKSFAAEYNRMENTFQETIL